MLLPDKVSLVTGASRGIGRAIALAYAKEGSNVAVNYLSSVKAAEEVASGVEELGRRATVIQADVSNKAEVEGMVNRVIKEFGKIDILVNNAGLPIVGASEDFEESHWRRGIDILLTGVFFCSQVVGREMIKRNGGKMINISSVAGLGAFPERACYCSAKAGVINLTRVLGCEWARYNINVNAIAPGHVRTDQTANLVAKGVFDEKVVAARTPRGKLGIPEDIARVAVFLASDETKHVTGQTIVVDGGWSSYIYLESWLESSRK